jgi:hypothetical protein
MCGKVYGIYDKRTQVCIYVGITKNSIYWRWGQHISSTFAKKPAQPKLNGYLLDEGYQGIVEHFEPRHLQGTPDDAYAVYEARQDLRNAEQAWIDHLKPEYNSYRAVAKPLHTFRECEHCKVKLRVGSRHEKMHATSYSCEVRAAWLKHKAWVKTQDPKDGPFRFNY